MLQNAHGSCPTPSYTVGLPEGLITSGNAFSDEPQVTHQQLQLA